MLNKIKIISIGKVKERYILEGIAEFEKRIKSFCKIEFIDLKDEGIKKESEKLEKYISDKTYILDAKGTQFSSDDFAGFLKKQEQEITFIIGGPEGISEEIKKKSKLISLSRMTFTHEMTKLFLVEQIYRAFMINNNRGYYHK